MVKKKVFFFVVLFFFCLVAVLSFRFWQSSKAKEVVFTPQDSAFELQPPTKALEGKLTETKGKVLEKARDKEEFEPVKKDKEILHGVRLATESKSQAVVEFADLLILELSANSEVGFINLIPEKFTLHQNFGEVYYELLQEEKPISVRSLNALVVFDSGEGRITINEDEIVVKILTGTARLALVDLDNETQTWQLQAGDQALIDDAQRRVEVK